MGLEREYEYIELFCDSRGAKNAGGNGSSRNWPLFDFARYNLRPAGIKIVQAEIPFVFDSIGPTNNVFTVNSTEVTIPPGTYDGPELATTLQQVLTTAIGAGWTVTYDPFTFKFTFSFLNPIPFTFNFGFKVFGPEMYLGFEKRGYTAQLGNTILDPCTLVSPIVALPTGPFYLYLNSTAIGNSIKAFTEDNEPRETQICRIPVDQQKGGLISYSDPSGDNFFDFVRGPGFNSFDLYLTLGDDEAQIPLDLKGAGFSVKIGILNYRPAGLPITQPPSFGGRSGPSYLMP